VDKFVARCIVNASLKNLLQRQTMLLNIIDTFFSFYARITSFPLIIQICISFILGSIILFTFFVSTVSFIRYQYNRIKIKEERILPIIDELILKYLFDEKSDFDPADIRQDFLNRIGKLTPQNLNFITDRLIACKNNFDIGISPQFNSVVRALGIDAHISKKLSFSSAYDKMKGIQELSSLAITASESEIFPFTYSPNTNIRKEARTSYMRLSKNDPFKFFDESKEPLNAWDQINLLKHLMSIENKIIPTFSKWIAYSQNESIILFCIKMCAYFKQYESIPVLINFLKTNDHELRAEAIKALGELNANQTEGLLIEMYNNQPDICQMEIIRAIGKFQSGQSIDFLHHAFENSTSIDTRKVAAEAIYNYGEIGRELYDALEQGNDPDSTLVLEHIANPLIKFK
jgi:hypothetical protein